MMPHLWAMVRFFNLKKSVRGDITKAPNAISWVYSLLNLAASGGGGDAQSMMKAWNLGVQIQCTHSFRHNFPKKKASRD